jgi:hypothetical protein
MEAADLMALGYRLVEPGREVPRLGVSISESSSPCGSCKSSTVSPSAFPSPGRPPQGRIPYASASNIASVASVRGPSSVQTAYCPGYIDTPAYSPLRFRT